MCSFLDINCIFFCIKLVQSKYCMILFCKNLGFFFVEMSTSKNEKCKGKHFTWSKPMSHMLLEILVEKALKGNKPSSTFKAESFIKVAT